MINASFSAPMGVTPMAPIQPMNQPPDLMGGGLLSPTNQQAPPMNNETPAVTGT